ncbi:hypothetical protein IC757_13015 [Wenzhouxiangella sp. AB-CW3]|uniref:hypothetical protein n=1 Tax=Wenzhouxiangella sp. AB-CW3 TaxID=2771012 RepID=UPI00168B0616|nr:hypothetical protein [Wenzhouxiangella sp. AB-CW3]QOC21942.1 hypothetical protein IC757_13015 [Wenzhouxiangella sp. AB-CW3]
MKLHQFAVVLACAACLNTAWGDDDQEREERKRQQQELQDLSCRDDLDRPESWLDRSHSYLGQRLCEPAAWFDGFFGDERALEETPVGTFFRFRNSVKWDQTEGTSPGMQVRANIMLPRISERVRLLVSRDEDLSSEFGDGPPVGDPDDRTRLGLRFLASDRARTRFDIDGTVRVSGTELNPRVRGRYRHVQGLTTHTLTRLTQSLFWEREEGVGTTSRVDWEWLPDRDRLVRWTGQGTWSEASDGVDWRSSLVGFRQLDASTALRGELGAFGFTHPRFEVEEYFVALRFRRQFLRHWLFYEIQPEHAWPRDFETGESRRNDWRLTFTLEVQFENRRARRERLRRYAGEQEELQEWHLEPIPVEAPGEERADDPVLEDEDNDENDEDSDNGETEDLDGA